MSMSRPHASRNWNDSVDGIGNVSSHPAGGQERTVRSYRGLRKENPIPQNPTPQAAQLPQARSRDCLLFCSAKLC